MFLEPSIGTFSTNILLMFLRKVLRTFASNPLWIFLWNVPGTFNRNIERIFCRSIQRKFAENVPGTFHRNVLYKYSLNFLAKSSDGKVLEEPSIGTFSTNILLMLLRKVLSIFLLNVPGTILWKVPGMFSMNVLWMFLRKVLSIFFLNVPGTFREHCFGTFKNPDIFLALGTFRTFHGNVQGKYCAKGLKTIFISLILVLKFTKEGKKERN